MTIISEIQNRGNALIENLGRVLQTADLDREFFHVPLWKHYYHALYWFDYHFAGPERFLKADFHVPRLENIDVLPDITVTGEQLREYYEAVAEKSRRYLETLTQEMLGEGVNQYNRLGRITGQVQHVSTHLGNINATTIIETNKWPIVSAYISKNGRLFE